MTQKEKVKQLIAAGLSTIAEIAEAAGILRPNIRRILGEGTKEGEFVRLAPGCYTLKKDGQQIAWLECGKAEEVAKDLADAGEKFDMIFLDPPYYSRELVGRNRLKKQDWYDFVHPQQFAEIMTQVCRLVSGPDTPVYLMLSAAPSARKDMQKYVEGAIWAGFAIAGEGTYLKTYANGEPVINIRGKQAAGERIILLNKSGCRGDETLDFEFPRPKGYPTQKPAGLLRQLIEQSTRIFDHVLDLFAGSGVTGQEALALQRRVTLVEKNMDAFQNHILKNINQNLLWH